METGESCCLSFSLTLCEIPWHFSSILQNVQISLTLCKFPWQFPDLEKFYFSLTFPWRLWTLMMTSSIGNIFRLSDAELWWFFYMCLNQQLSKQWGHRWFETPWRSSWRHDNENVAQWIHLKTYIVLKLSRRCNEPLILCELILKHTRLVLLDIRHVNLITPFADTD